MKKVAIILVIILMTILVYFKLATLTSEPVPLVIMPPVSQPGTIANLDKSFLKIKLLQNKYEVSLFAKTITTAQPDSVENFIVKNEHLVDRDKVAVEGNQHMKEFQVISSILQKNGIISFRVNSR